MDNKFLLVVVTVLLAGCAGTQKETVIESAEPTEEVSKATDAEKESSQKDWPLIKDGTVVFYFERSQTENVAVAGDFSNWNRVPLEEVEDGIFKKEISVDPGRYQYKLIVDGNWVTDPENSKKISDGRGGKNSLLEVPEK
ncbi:MAG: glycogen-binding domain-containing protein [Elusimicrobiota bacterium]